LEWHMGHNLKVEEASQDDEWNSKFNQCQAAKEVTYIL
jgi:hypothetical protein